MKSDQVSIQAIAATIQKDIQPLIQRKDIHNVIQKACKEKFAGRSPTQVLLDDLQEKEWFFHVERDDSGQITHLFFAHPKSIELTQRYPSVLIMDCTYKTNRYKLPLLHTVGITPWHSTFTSSYCFIMDEAAPDYVWVLDSMRSALGGNTID